MPLNSLRASKFGAPRKRLFLICFLITLITAGTLALVRPATPTAEAATPSSKARQTAIVGTGSVFQLPRSVVAASLIDPGIGNNAAYAVDRPVIDIGDCQRDEGNADTTTYSFSVTLSTPAGPGGVTFDIATRDFSATAADNDYVPRSLTGVTIPYGSTGYTFDVLVIGDLQPEPSEGFFVDLTNISRATPGDFRGFGGIFNDDGSAPIHLIQGSGSTSLSVGVTLDTTGIVTGRKLGGYFLQTPDAEADSDPNTSEGIFVYTSSPPPPEVAIGNKLFVRGTVREYVGPIGFPSPPQTRLESNFAVLISTGNPLPAAVPLTAADLTPNGGLEQLEKFEGMRVSVASLTVVGATEGSITDTDAMVTSTGAFVGVITGVAPPFREAGIELPEPIPTPTPNPNNIPRFDANPERIRVDSDAQPGAVALEVSAGAVVTGLVGPLDYEFRTYSICPDAANPPTVTNNNLTAMPVPSATARELTVVSFNLRRFFDTVNDPMINEPVLTQAAFDGRLNKASLAIRNVQQLPDVIGVEEVENLATLQALAGKVNADAVSAGQGDPHYTAYLSEGNNPSGLDIGFLVKGRITVISVTQVGQGATYIDPNTGTPALLNDHPPLILMGRVVDPLTPFPLSFTVIVNQLLARDGLFDFSDGNRIRTKRREQALFLANLIQTRQVNDPDEVLITMGDLNAFQLNDGYVDSVGIIKGTPAPPDQVSLFGADVVSPDQVDLVDLLPAVERYSYNDNGNNEVLDHILVNQRALNRLNRFHYARNGADYPAKYYADFTRAEGISDHDIPVAYFTLAARIKPSDFDGDGRTDFSIFRPASGDWYSSSSLGTAAVSAHFGLGSDTIVPGDYDGDGRTDFAVYRAGDWYLISSGSGDLISDHLGEVGDLPVPADYDGQGTTNLAVFNNGTWRIRLFATTITAQWGSAGDTPVPADYNGDGQADLAVFRDGVWNIFQSLTGTPVTYSFGSSGDIPVPGDYDGDGKADLAVFRSGAWYVLNSGDQSVRSVNWGLASDVVVPGNYDDDNRTDLAVFRDGVWYVWSSYTNAFTSASFGQAGDTPVPRGYIKPLP